MKPHSDMIDIYELSALIGMPVIQIAALCRNGLLPHHVIDGGYWFKKSELAGSININTIK